MIDIQGVFDIPSADYHADPCPTPSLSRGQAHALLTKSPAHARHTPDKEPTDPMKIGTIAHRILLGKGDEYAISPYDRWQSNQAKEWKEEQEKAGILPIKRKQFDVAQAMVERCREQLAHHEIQDIFGQAGESEVTVLWQEQGIWLRCRIDRVPEDIHALYDYKTKASASDNEFQRAAWRDGDWLQSHFYPRGLAAVTGRDPIEIPFRFVVQEQEPPHFLNVIEMSGECLLMAEEQTDKAIRIWRHCNASGKWPGYGHRVRLIDPPGYAITGWERQKSIDELEPAA